LQVLKSARDLAIKADRIASNTYYVLSIEDRQGTMLFEWSCVVAELVK